MAIQNANLVRKPAMPSSGRQVMAGVPEGFDAMVLADLAQRSDDGVLHVAIDDAAMDRLADTIAFFAPDLPVLRLPGWDCLPYDRISPTSAVVARRLDTLSTLAQGESGSRLVITTVAAATQFVPARVVFAEASFKAETGKRIDLEAFKRFLANNGYHRTETVREAGEYAIRGGIVDLFSSSLDEPVRIDLFGDEIEKIRSFDPLSQRNTGELDRLALKPASEVFLDQASIERFRSAYRHAFGTVIEDDPLYLAISEGRRFAGMEHWLPFFHAAMESVFDYMPGALVTLDPQVDEARDERLAHVRDFYEARQQQQAIDKKTKNPQYKPIDQHLLYMPVTGWQQQLDSRNVIDFRHFAPGEDSQAEDAGGRKARNFAEARNKPDVNLFDVVGDYIRAAVMERKRVLLTAYTEGSAQRLASVLADHDIEPVEPVQSWRDASGMALNVASLAVTPIANGFTTPDLVVITEQDIFGDRLSRPKPKRKRSDKFVLEAASLAAGDLVVHIEHGIGRYDGLEVLEVAGAPHECLRIVYDASNKLFVPVENIEVISRYGSEESEVALDRLGGAGWQGRKARIKKRLKDMADALLKIAAARHLKTADALIAQEGLYNEFSSGFPYTETDDQLRAIENVTEDLSSGKPMDRLVCGDVGFGKTEVALRAAFVAAMSGRQVAVVVPTTLLARQHFSNFQNRFSSFKLRVAQLSRLVPAGEAKLVKEGLADGSIDIVIGTHSLLAKGIGFGRLGLVIVDEEQRFGVKQKERLKELTDSVHVLTLTATPIPRTLQLALTGVKELSLIATPAGGPAGGADLRTALRSSDYP